MLRKFNKDPAPLNKCANHLFERASVQATTPADWTEVDGGLPNSSAFGRFLYSAYSSAFNSHVDHYTHLTSEGFIYTFGLYNDSQSITANDYWEITQSVDVTDVDFLAYTVAVSAKTGQGSCTFKSYLDANELDSIAITADGSVTTYANRAIDVSAHTGTMTLKFRLTAGTTAGTSYVCAELTNVRLFKDNNLNGPIYCFPQADRSQVTVTVSNDSTTEPIANTIDLYPDNTGASTNSADDNVVYDFGTHVSILRPSISFVALFNHNFVEGETVKMQLHSADSWGSPDVDITMTWDQGTLYAVVPDYPRVYRYMRIYTTGKADRTAGLVIGTIVWGTAGRLAQMYSIGEQFERDYGVIVNESTGGREWRKKRFTRSTFRAVFEDLSPTELKEYLYLAQLAHGRLNPFALVPAPDDATYPELCMFGTLLSGVRAPEKDFQLYDQDFVFRELVWGRTV